MSLPRFARLSSTVLRKRAPGVTDWLCKNITLPREFTSRPGRFSTAGRPYMRSILECFHPESGVTDVDLSAATQLLKTTIMMAGCAYRIAHAPTSKLMVVPTKEIARDLYTSEKLHPLINANPVLAKYKPVDEDNFTHTRMAMLGGTISVVGVNSPVGLGGRTVGMVLQDEVCKFKKLGSEQSPEAHPMALADERTKDFGIFGFRYKASTPNTTTHPFWKKVEQGDQTEFVVPCRNCREYFPFQFIRAEDTPSGYQSLTWSKDAKDASGMWVEEKVMESARYICPKCGYPHQSYEKASMIEAYEEHRTNPLADASHRSFIIPSFYAPTVSFGQMAWEWISQGDLYGHQNYYNAWLALPYAEIDVKVGDEDVRSLIRTDYTRGQTPFVPRYCLITGDPGQRTGVHWMAAAVSDEDEIAVVDWGATLAEAYLPHLAQSIQPVLASDRTKAYRIGRGLCDSRYNTDAVMQMCYQSSGFFWPTLGQESDYGYFSVKPVTAYPGMDLFQFVDHTLKNELYGRRIKRKDGPRIYLPADADPMLIAQLSNQQLDSRTNRWKRRENDHLGDCLKQVILYQWVARGVQMALNNAAKAAAPAPRRPGQPGPAGRGDAQRSA